MRWFTAIIAVAAMVTVSYAGRAARRHLLQLRRVPNVPKGTKLPPDQWFEQKLDHFDPTNAATWKQRYQVNEAFFRDKRNGPVFLMIGGEGPATAESLVAGAWVTMYAKKYGALCIQLEHRFYGKSHPTNDISTVNLKYLSSKQALADLAYFIEAMNEKYKLTSINRWISFGGSYAGSLSAWLRLKYPQLVHAAISSSAPLLAIADFKQYDEVVKAALATSTQNCVDQLKSAVKEFDKLVSTKEGAETVDKKFKLCSPLNIQNQDDVDCLASFLSDEIRAVVQSTINFTVDQLCEILTNSSIGPPLERYAMLSNIILSRQDLECMEDLTYDQLIQEQKNTSWNEIGERQWKYQTCVEFGWYPTSSTNNSLFGPMDKLPFFTKQCKDVFGENFNENLLNDGIKWTNIEYGALNIDATRVLFVHGTLDPWHVLGINTSRSEKEPLILIEGGDHCSDMYPPNFADSPPLVAARKKIVKYIGNWLKDDDVDDFETY